MDDIFKAMKPEASDAIRRIPELKSVLYDLNLLPESLAAFKKTTESKEYFYMMSVIMHFIAIEERLSNG